MLEPTLVVWFEPQWPALVELSTQAPAYAQLFWRGDGADQGVGGGTLIRSPSSRAGPCVELLKKYKAPGERTDRFSVLGGTMSRRSVAKAGDQKTVSLPISFPSDQSPRQQVDPRTIAR